MAEFERNILRMLKSTFSVILCGSVGRAVRKKKKKKMSCSLKIEDNQQK